MNAPDFSWILTLQFVLPFFVLSVLLIFVIISGRKKFKEASKRLIVDVKSNEDKEKQTIVSFLVEKLSLDEKIAKQKAKKIMNERKFMVRNLVSGLLDKNVEAISQINQDLSRVTNHYHKLEIITPSIEESVLLNEVDEHDDSGEVIELKEENNSLKKEVHITLTTLNNIFKEFSSMFGEDDTPDGLMSVDQIITAMESFSNKAANVSVETVESTVDSKKAVSDGIKENNNNVDNESALPENVVEEGEKDGGNASVDSEIEDIDNALDELELDVSDEEEPDWGDAFAESGDVMEEDEPKK